MGQCAEGRSGTVEKQTVRSGRGTWSAFVSLRAGPKHPLTFIYPRWAIPTNELPVTVQIRYVAGVAGSQCTAPKRPAKELSMVKSSFRYRET
jgi:hypothetical protein